MKLSWEDTGFFFNRYIWIVFSCLIFLSGCMGGLIVWKGHIVREDNRITLAETAGKHHTVWNTDDLSLRYNYLLKEDRIQLDGEITLESKLTNFTVLDNFSFMAESVDSKGMVLGQETLYTSPHRDSISTARLSFSRSFALPEGTVYMAFSYSGTVNDGGGDDAITWDFWRSP